MINLWSEFLDDCHQDVEEKGNNIDFMLELFFMLLL